MPSSYDPNVVTVGTPGSRAFLIRGDRGFILVDTGMDPSGKSVLKALADRGAGPADLRLILLTHGHVDHCGGARALRAASGAPVLAHRLEAAFIRQGISSPTVAQSRAGRLINALTKGMKNPPCAVDLEMDDGWDLAPYGVSGRVLATPGHTNGSVSVVLGSGVALVGDLLRGKPGALGLGFFYEDRAAVLSSIDLLAATSARTFVFAHGTQVDRDGWTAFGRRLQEEA